MSDDHYSTVPPGDSYSDLARIEALLWREQLAEPEDRPSLDEATWVANIPCGPHNREGRRRLQQVQERYGSVNVTTGNAQPPGVRGLLCGIYVRDDVLRRPENPLRAVLRRPR